VPAEGKKSGGRGPGDAWRRRGVAGARWPAARTGGGANRRRGGSGFEQRRKKELWAGMVLKFSRIPGV